MDKEFTASNFIPEKLLDIIYILERDEKHHPYKIIRNKNNFSLIVKFGAKNAETTPLKNNASAKRTARYQDKKQVSSEDKLCKSKRKRGKKKSSPRASGKSASQHTDKNQDSSNVGQAEQPKLKKKKTPAQVARDRDRRKSYWKRIKLARQLRKAKLRAESLAAYYAQLQETRTVASPQVSVDRHPDNSECVDTSTVSEPHRHLPVERETVNIHVNQVQPDLNELSAQEAESEQSSILDSDELEFRQYFFNQSSESDSESVVDSPNVCGNCMKQGEEFPRCTGCKFVRYCSKKCQVTDWPSHKQLCQSIQTLPSVRDCCT